MARCVYKGLGGLVMVAMPVILPLAALRRRWRQGLLNRLTFQLPKMASGTPVVWLHAASVGEVLALSPLIDFLKQAYPKLQLAVSTQTAAGYRTACNRLTAVPTVFYFPLDLPGFAARVLRRLKPMAVLFTETEIWPGLIFAAADRSIPTVMVSGRISAGAFRWYRRGRIIFAPALSLVSLFCVQGVKDRQRLIALGVDEEAVVVTGSLKGAAVASRGGRPGWLDLLPGADQRPVFIAGSTHRGEEEQVIRAFAEARKAVPEALLILAPRHGERFGEVGRLLAGSELSFERRSRLSGRPSPAMAGAWEPAVVLLDTIGELAFCYSGAAVAFVGGSLVEVGGHNLLEPALHRCPVLFGPHTENSEEAARFLLDGGGGVRVNGEREMALWLRRLLASKGAASEMGEKAYHALVSRGASVPLTAGAISRYLERML